MSATVGQQVAVEKVGEDEFVSKFLPQKMGNTLDIAYGGCALGAGINAAYQTVKPDYHAYTAMGSYLGPALTTLRFKIKISRVRDTRSFATRTVEVGQDTEKGYRSCCFFMVDFQVQEPASMMEFAAPPVLPAEKMTLEDSVKADQYVSQLVQEKKVHPKVEEVFTKTFGLMNRYFEVVLPKDSVSLQSMYSMAPRLATTQDHLPITDKISADWKRSRHTLSTEGEQVGALGFHMDGALAFCPLTHDHKGLSEAGACSSLDFSLRIMSNNVRCEDWHYREMRTVQGGSGRSYTEARLWDKDGQMVAHMSQVSILRPKVKEGAAKL